MTIETNMEPSGTLKESADQLLTAAMAYWQEYRKATGGAAVVWVKDSDGRMVVLTRGEYEETLMRNIHILKREGDRVHSFGDDPTAARLAAAEQMAQALRRLYASHADFLWCAEKPAWSPPDIKWSREIHEAAETALAAWEQSK